MAESQLKEVYTEKKIKIDYNNFKIYINKYNF